MAGELPDLDDDIDTLISKNLKPFQDKPARDAGVAGVTGVGDDGAGTEDGKLSREELRMKLRQKTMFYNGRRLKKSAQQLKLENAKKLYQDKMKKEAEAEQAQVVGNNLERNRRKRARKNAKKKRALAKLRESGVGGDEANET